MPEIPEREEVEEDRFRVEFLATEPQGGPHPLEPYSSGYELGRLHALIETAARLELLLPVLQVGLDNAETVKQMAMAYSFSVKEDGPTVEGCVFLKLEPICFCDDCLRADDAGI